MLRITLFVSASLCGNLVCVEGQCQDTEDWNNGYDRGCSVYDELYCKDQMARPGQSFALGRKYNYPERHCCSCGKLTFFMQVVTSRSDSRRRRRYSRRRGRRRGARRHRRRRTRQRNFVMAGGGGNRLRRPRWRDARAGKGRRSRNIRRRGTLYHRYDYRHLSEDATGTSSMSEANSSMPQNLGFHV